MSDAESFNPPDKRYPYAWLRRDHLKMLADFLQKKVIEDSEVKELVILGDLFDQWVYPAELKPPPTADEYFQGIFDAKQNHDVIEKLEKIATDGRLIYVPGNHDMLLTKEFLECHFPGVIYKGTELGGGIFKEDGIIAEHGSMYCLFNAPDPCSKSPSRDSYKLPLGYFITRAVTEKVARTGCWIKYLDVLKDAIEEIIEDILKSNEIKPAEVVFDSICCDCSVKQIEMDKLDSYLGSVTVKNVDCWYGNLYKKWENHKGDHKDIPALLAIVNDIGILDFAAVSEYNHAKEKSIVIFGHTHEAVIWKGPVELSERMLKKLGMKLLEEIIRIIFRRKKLDAGAGVSIGDIVATAKKIVGKDFIYANCGTWINPQDENQTEPPGVGTKAKPVFHRTYIEQIYNASGHKIEFRNLDHHQDNESIDDNTIQHVGGGSGAVIPKADSEKEWQKSHMKIVWGNQTQYCIWQHKDNDGNHIRYSKGDVYKKPGDKIPGDSSVAGPHRQLEVRPDGIKLMPIPLCTFVETEIKDRKHYVRSKQYKGDGKTCCLGEKYIEL
jgi:hypothetical protein